MDAIVVGGGIAGLCCAKQLQSQGKSCVVLEASDRIGGRIATDEIDGFKLDRGFQVFLTSYPEAKKVLDYDALQLRDFEPGALVFHGGKFHRLSDPWRRPQHFLSTAMSGAATFGDKLKIAKLRKHVSTGSLEQLYRRPEMATIDGLARFGFSDVIIQRFFRPFLGGVFLDPGLITSTRMFEFVFRMFSQGNATLPTNGMQAIPKQIADGLPNGTIRLNSKVAKIDGQSITLDSGETLSAPAIMLATANPEAKSLAEVTPRESCGVTCIYFATETPPIDEPILVLNGEETGPINNLCVPSQVSDSYSTTNKSLLSVTVLGIQPDSIVDEVRAQLTTWFGDVATSYTHLRTYQIPFALPSQANLDPLPGSVRIRNGLYRCSDDCDTASINGAMLSGRRAAEAAVEEVLA